MALRKPYPNDKLSYFTRRTLGDKGKVIVWRFEGEELANIEYTCPHCGSSGEKQQPFARQKKRMEIAGKKKVVDVFTFTCDSCNQNIDLEKWGKKGPGRRKAA